MKIGVIGPTRVKEFCITINAQQVDYLHFLETIGEYLASTDNELVIMPAYDSAQGIIARNYKDYKGKEVIGLIPEDDTEFGLMDLDRTTADTNINCGTWRNQPEAFCEESDILLVVGLSPGAMIEICYSKWFKVKDVFIMSDFMSSKLHPEVEKDLRVEYITMNELKDKIK